MKSKDRSAHMTISVPLDVKQQMENRTEINWSRVATKAFQRRLEAEKMLEEFAEPGITEEEAIHQSLRIKHKALTRTK